MSKRRLWIVVGLFVIVFGIVAAAAGPRLYAAAQPEARDPLSVTAPAPPSSASGSTTPRPATADNGTWTVGAGSQAGYRIREVLNGADVTVVGRTNRVTGSATVADGKLTAANVVVDAASIATDQSGRDNYFRFTVMATSKYPNATFTLTSPVALPEIGASPTEVKAAGTLELAGKKRDVTATLQVVRDGGRVSASGSIPIAVRDYGIDPPNLGFVKVEDSGQVEFLVNLTQGR
ncbi:YceI family protein [Sinomonas flava]|uniref:Lipid/polyisoprenoid-binding YceI-like domain-containing protein n=1 Tax=Sinomonas flava TaxID=496857 RepID=A0ABN3BYG4_9MICC